MIEYNEVFDSASEAKRIDVAFHSGDRCNL
jgi:hypothetical protein